MKKLLGLLFISSSMFSMQLALQMPAQRFIKHSVAMINTMAKDVRTPLELNIPKLKIDSASIQSPRYMEDIELYHGKKGFVVVQDGKNHLIESVLMNKTAREITKSTLKPFLKSGFLTLKQTNDGKFTLQAHHRLPGGGPIFGAIMYWVTKSVCYGTAVAAVGTIAVGTGGAVVALTTSGAVVAGTGAVLGTAAATTTATVTAAAATTTVASGTVAVIASGTAAAVTGGASTVAGAIAVTGGASKAALVTAGVVSSAGGIGATIAGVESVSLAVGTFFGMLPTP